MRPLSDRIIATSSPVISSPVFEFWSWNSSLISHLSLIFTSFSTSAAAPNTNLVQKSKNNDAMSDHCSCLRRKHRLLRPSPDFAVDRRSPKCRSIGRKPPVETPVESDLRSHDNRRVFPALVAPSPATGIAVKPAVLVYKTGMCVYHKSQDGMVVCAQVLGVHGADDPLDLRYTIKINGKGEKQVDGADLALEKYCFRSTNNTRSGLAPRTKSPGNKKTTSMTGQDTGQDRSTVKALDSDGILPGFLLESSADKRNHYLKRFRKDYKLGDTLCSPSHATSEPNSRRACRAVSSLRVHDFAFVKRSDGSFSYAILAYRSVRPTEKSNNKSMEECMTFVLSSTGSKKTIFRSKWGKQVRLVSMDESSLTAKCYINTST